MNMSDIIPPGRTRQKNVYSPVWLSLAIFVMIALCIVPAWAENVSGVNVSGVGGDDGDAMLPFLNTSLSGENDTPLLNTSLSGEDDAGPIPTPPLPENTSALENETHAPVTVLQSTVLSSPGGVIPAVDDVYLTLANDAGAFFDDFGDDTFHVSWHGGGLNSLHISNSSGGYGQVTYTHDQSGTFYVTTTGGRGYQDDIFLCVAVNGTIPDDFRLHILADGYQWVPNPTPHQPPVPGTEHYEPVTIDEWFTKDDLIYGPQTWRPAAKMQYPIYPNQDVGDTSNQFQMMFIDLNAGILSDKPLRVKYELRNLRTMAAFNVYGYARNVLGNSRTDFIYKTTEWTNRLTGYPEEFSGWYVSGAPQKPPVRVDITSSDIELPINGKITFHAIAYDEFDEEMLGAVFEWTSSDPAVGEVDGNGRFTPKSLGETEVNATCAGVSDSIRVTVIPEVPIALDKIVLTPSRLDLYSDDTRTYRFNPVGYDQFGELFPVSSYQWSGTDDSVCTVDEITGLMSINGVGSATVSASNSTVTGTAEVSVRERPDWTLELVGAVNRTIDRAEFIDLANAHPATHIDNRDNVWEGVNLSALVGLVDDGDPATFNRALAGDLYRVFVTPRGGDEHSDITSDEMLGDNTFVVAYRLNGEEIPDRPVNGEMSWPLKLHGSGCALHGNSLDQVAKIEFSIRPAVSKLEMNAIHRWDNDHELYKIPVSAYDEFGSVISDEKYVLRYEWKSSNESVGTVDKDGYLSVKGAGTTQVTASFGDTTANADVIVYRSADDSHILNVDGSGKTGFKTIPEAIAFSQAGDIIVVKNGTYAENLIVDKPVTIRSENGSLGATIGSGIAINSDNVCIHGFTINGDVFVNDGFKRCVIDNNSVFGGGIHLMSGSSHCTISNNKITSTNYAISLRPSSDNLIISNNITAGSFNIGWSPSQRNVVKDNVVRGIFSLSFSSDSIVDGNVIFLDSSVSALFPCSSSKNVTIVNNTVCGGDSCSFALLLKDITDSKVYNNRMSGGRSATVYIPKHSRLLFYQNDIVGQPGKLLNCRDPIDLNSTFPVTYIFNNETYTGYIGNHYSTYAGEDTNGDGIGETPVKGNKGTDNYPLISPIDTYLILTPTTVTVSPTAATLEVAESVDFTVEVFDQRGERMSHVVPVWSSSNTTFGRVNATTGHFEALSPGSVTVTSDCDGCTGSAAVTVVPATKKTETISFAIPNCTFAENSSGHSISVNASAASVNGSRITLPGNGFTLTVLTTSDPVTADGWVNATYDGLVLETDPLVADLPLPGPVSGSIRANLTGLPAGAGITTTLNQNITSEAMSAFQLAAGGDGLNVDAVAFTMNIVKTNLTNGQDVTGAVIRMTVSPAWVDAHGGVGAVRIIRWAEDDTKEVLATRLVGTDTSGNMIFEADSPRGLSLFGLSAISRPTPDQPAGRSSSGGGPSDVAAIAGSIPEGEAQSFAVKGLAIERITVEARDAIPDLLVTVEKASLPKDIAAPGPTVYEVDRAVLYRADPSSIADIVIEFSVPKAWLDAHSLSSGQITLLQYSDGRWKGLQTTLLKETDERAYYSAGADEFSYFAIVPGTAASAGSQVQVEATTMPPGEAVPTASPSPSGTTLPQKSPLLWGLAIIAFGAVFVMRRR